MLGRSLKMAFWIFHDHLGKLLIANFIAAVAVAIPVGIALPTIFSGDLELFLVVGAPMFYVGIFLAAPVFGAGMAHLAKTLIDKKDGSLSDLFDGIRTYAPRAAALGLCYALAFALLGTSAWFYAAKLQDTAPLLGYAISVFAVWCIAVLLLASLLVLPALVQRKAGVFATIRLALLLVLANPVLTLGIALQVVMLSIITVAVLPLFFAGYGAAVLCISSAAYELLARKYDPNKPDATSIEDAEDDYLNRGMKDLFFPWKS